MKKVVFTLLISIGALLAEDIVHFDKPKEEKDIVHFDKPKEEKDIVHFDKPKEENLTKALKKKN